MRRLKKRSHYPLYRGEHNYKSRNGVILRLLPPLVDENTWHACRAVLEASRSAPKRSNPSAMLQGVLKCGGCGASYICINGRRKGRREVPYYRCRTQAVPARLRDGPPCRAAMVRALDVERIVWQKVYDLIADPREAIDIWQKQIEDRKEKSEDTKAEKQRIDRALVAKATEKDRVYTLFRRGLMSLDDAEGQLEAIRKEAAELQARLDTLAAQEEVLKAGTENYRATVDLLNRYRAGLQAIEAGNDPKQKGEIIRRLLPRITVETSGEARKKTVVFRAYFRSAASAVFHVDSAADFGYSAHHR
jgi:hypothetical protein